MKKALILISFLGSAFASTTPLLPAVPMPGTSSALPSSSSSQASAPACKNTIEQQALADSLFAMGRWEEAAVAYESLCPCVSRKARTTCLLQAIRAIAQDSTRIAEAVKSIDNLSLTTEPEDSGFGELMMTQAMLYVQTGEPARALKSWKLARQVVMPGQDVNLKALCTQIRQQLKDSTLATDCNKIPVLAKQLAQAIPSTAPAKLSSGVSTTQSSSAATQPALATNPAATGTWILQFGAFSSKENAELLLQNLKSRKIPSRLVTKNTSTKTLWLVQTDPFRDKESALQYGNSTLEPLGLDYQALPNP